MAVHDPIDGSGDEQQRSFAWRLAMLKGNRPGEGVQVLQQPTNTHVAPWVAVLVREVFISRKLVGDGVGGVLRRSRDQRTILWLQPGGQRVLSTELSALSRTRWREQWGDGHKDHALCSRDHALSSSVEQESFRVRLTFRQSESTIGV